MTQQQPHQKQKKKGRILCLPSFAYALVLLAFVAIMQPASLMARPLTIFAAASLEPVAQEAATLFSQKTGTKVRLSAASSSSLARQIETGAPADIFLSANVRWMDYLGKQDLIRKGSRTDPIGNQLVLIADGAKNWPELTTLQASDIAKILGPRGRIALGDPDHVPAGLYAKESLQALGLWHHLERKIARTDNARAALALVERGQAPLGIVYKTDAILSKSSAILHRFAPQATLIRYAFAIPRHSQNSRAQDFLDFLTSKDGLRLFKRYGFTILDSKLTN